MRVLFVSFPHHTHYYSMVPLASALRTAGHEVRVASHPDITEQITAAGLTAVPVGTPDWYFNDPHAPELLGQVLEDGSGHVQGFDFTRDDPGQWTHESLLALENIAVAALYASVSNDGMLDDLVAYARHWRPDLVIWEQHTFAGAVAARAVGAAHARLLHGVDITVRARQEFLRQSATLPGPVQDPTAEWLGRAVRRYAPHLGFTEEMVTGQWTIDITPPGSRLDLGLRTVGVRHVPHNGASVVPHWLRAPAERPRVCLTLGLSGELDHAPFSVAALLDGLAGLDAEIVAALGAQAELPGPVPENVRLVDFVPLNDLLPTCAAVVHHGGIGTRATAELHGVPQLMLPYGWDTVAKARRVAELGYGLYLPAADLTVEALRAAVERLLTEESFTKAADRVRAEILTEPTPNEAVDVLERLTAESTPRTTTARLA
ncbi:activator-dependent family glycosyltransferase [Streptomyces sp. AC602_WCS936]|uniref:activator-dependent family glycosyltransferase n=1 Tax=Streptomyces sp. AC602_WCS936 TaxID=2823685 RepID=UPI001C266F13|nr:activator-dependent family glycosyltransferase [Streptomyces sp. AC602_WCS936]